MTGKGIVNLTFVIAIKQQTGKTAMLLKTDSCKILSGLKKTGDGYCVFELPDNKNNRIEITSRFTNLQLLFAL
jgi:hypothetical protein